jgi:hypothetical protein
VLEHFRGDDRGVFLHGMLSTSQLLGLIMAAGAIIMIIVLRRTRV